MTEPAAAAVHEPPTKQFWWLHDARWYQGVARRFGQQAANEINAEALRFVARRIAGWAAAEYGVVLGDRPLADFIRDFVRIPALMWPDGMMEVQHTVRGDNEMDTAVTKNFALTMLRAAGAIEGYECPCLDMRAGWFEGLGIEVSDQKLCCQRDGADACRFRAVIHRGDQPSEPTSTGG